VLYMMSFRIVTLGLFSDVVSIGFPLPIHAKCVVMCGLRDVRLDNVRLRYSSVVSNGIPRLTYSKYGVLLATLGVGSQASFPLASGAELR
jgi:hypothetical protein